MSTYRIWWIGFSRNQDRLIDQIAHSEYLRKIKATSINPRPIYNQWRASVRAENRLNKIKQKKLAQRKPAVIQPRRKKIDPAAHTLNRFSQAIIRSKYEQGTLKRLHVSNLVD